MVWASRLEAIAAAVRHGDWVLRQHVDDNREKDPDRPTNDQIRDALLDQHDEQIGEDSDHPYGPSCLIRAVVGGRVIHVLCTYPPSRPIWVITAYWPDTQPWKWVDNDYRERRTI